VNTITSTDFTSSSSDGESLLAKAERLPGGEKVASAARLAAQGLEHAKDYVRERDLKGMLSDLQAGVKRHPGATLLIAAAVGFLLLRAFSRD
jgi:hypothetical protein